MCVLSYTRSNSSGDIKSQWLKDFRESGDIPVRGSGNYASDEQKEIARLRRELRDAQDALDVLKKAINILGK